MKRKFLSILLSLALALSLLPASALADGPEGTPSVTEITIFTTNDLHGNVAHSDTTIGLAQAAAIKASTPNSLLVDAGDATQGASFATISKGADVIEVMNAAGYDAMAAGNHEFDYGADTLLANAEAANFPILAANVTRNGKTMLDASTVVEAGGKKIGFIGLTTAATATSTNPGQLAGIEFMDEVQTAIANIHDLENKTDAIVLLCHMGENEAAVPCTSKQLMTLMHDMDPEAHDQVSAIVDGHSHETYEDGIAGIPIIQAGVNGAAMGKITLELFDDGGISFDQEVLTYDEAMNYLLTDAGKAAAKKVEDTLAAIQAEQKATLGEKLIDNLVPVWGGNVYWDYSENRIVETAYGDLVTDAFAALGREFAETQDLDLPVIALENGGGIAQPMYQGTVTYGDILDAFNHGNLVEAWKVTPAQLYTALEVGLTMTGQDDTGLLVRERVSGSFLQVSGFTYTYDPAGETGAKVTDVTLEDGTALKRDDTTTQLLLATTNYVASFAGISQGEKLGELAGEDMAVCDWLMNLTENGTVPLNYPVSADRIRIAGDKSPETYAVSIPVLDEYDRPVAGLPVHVNVDGGAYEAAVTDENGLVAVTVSKGPHAVGLEESGSYVYVNNYSGSGTVTTKEGYCEFAFQVETGAMPFTDVAEDAWYHDAVAYVYDNGLMNGVSKTTFDPSATTSRAMTAQVLWNLEEKPVVNYLMPFTDVAEEQWYTEAVRWATSERVVNGYSSAVFGPNDPVTREQLAAMIYRYEQSKGGGYIGDWTFRLDAPDAGKVSLWADEAMHWCVMKGIITGKNGGLLDPQGLATRAELAQMLARYVQLG